MSSNGCGGAGEISRAWRSVLGTPPPWEGCCDQHDLAYSQGGPAEWRAWLYWLAVRLFGARHWADEPDVAEEAA